MYFFQKRGDNKKMEITVKQKKEAKKLLDKFNLDTDIPVEKLEAEIDFQPKMKQAFIHYGEQNNYTSFKMNNEIPFQEAKKIVS